MNPLLSLLGYCYGANNKKRFISISSMQAMDCPVPATLLSICRQGLFFIPLLYILKAGFELQGINYTQTISDYLAIVISLLLLRRSLRKFNGDPS